MNLRMFCKLHKDPTRCHPCLCSTPPEPGQSIHQTASYPRKKKKNPFPKLVSKLQLCKTRHIILNLCSTSDGAALGEAYINVSASSCEIVFLLTGHRREPERPSSEQRRGQLPNIIRTPVERKETLSWQTCLTD